jgi:hypothetical protein
MWYLVFLTGQFEMRNLDTGREMNVAAGERMPVAKSGLMKRETEKWCDESDAIDGTHVRCVGPFWVFDCNVVDEMHISFPCDADAGC